MWLIKEEGEVTRTRTGRAAALGRENRGWKLHFKRCVCSHMGLEGIVLSHPNGTVFNLKIETIWHSISNLEDWQLKGLGDIHWFLIRIAFIYRNLSETNPNPMTLQSLRRYLFGAYPHISYIKRAPSFCIILNVYMKILPIAPFCSADSST